MRHKKNEPRNLKLALIFFAIVFGLIILSGIIKLGLLVKNSTYDGLGRFTIGVVEKDKVAILSFSPDNQTISILSIKGVPQDKNFSRFLSVPVNGYMTATDLDITKENVSSVFPSLILNGSKVNLTIIDLLKLTYFVKSVPQSYIYEKSISSNSAKTAIQAAVASYFLDSQIVDEKLDIEVINASDTPGLGTKLSNFITNMGGSVVMITTSDKPQKESKIIYSNGKSYTADKLSSILGIRVEEAIKPSIADIVVIVGEDSLKNLKF